LSTGERKKWLGMNRRVHRSMCILMTLFVWVYLPCPHLKD
jgi:hypothetical protein